MEQTHEHAHAHTHTHPYTYIHTHVHTYTHPRYTNIHMCTLTFTHTQAACPWQLASQLGSAPPTPGLPSPVPRPIPSPFAMSDPPKAGTFLTWGIWLSPQEKPPGGGAMFIKRVTALHRTIVSLQVTSHKCKQAEPACFGHSFALGP